MIAKVRGVVRRAGVDRAVMFGLLASGWQIGSAPITILLLSASLSPEAQGFYYTFASLIGLQSFVELGLFVVILSVASHEWARLGLDNEGRITGDPNAISRLVSLGRFVFQWYAVGSTIFAIGIGTVGFLFLSRQSGIVTGWEWPWVTLVLLSALSLWALPFNALLEGCNQVVVIQRFRFSQLVLRSGALWLTLWLGGGLWAAAAAAATGVLRDLYLFGVQYRRFFRPFLHPPSGAAINWRTEILPMQWRLALEGAVGYFLFQLFTPVMFYYHGAVVAGRTGMTWSVVSAIQSVASRWLQPKVPRFGMLIAKRNYDELDSLWSRTTRASALVALLAAGVSWLLIWALNHFDSRLAERLLPPLPAGLFLLGAVFMSVDCCLSAYLRAHKEEPLLVMSLVTSIVMGLLVWGLGSHFGPVGASAAYLLVCAGISLPWQTLIWRRCRAEWHKR